MAKATLILPNGTVVEIDGSTEEVKELLEFYGGASRGGSSATRKKSARKATRKQAASKSGDESDTLDLAAIVNEVKSSPEMPGT